jgi:hypothetical protein
MKDEGMMKARRLLGIPTLTWDFATLTLDLMRRTFDLPTLLFDLGGLTFDPLDHECQLSRPGRRVSGV